MRVQYMVSGRTVSVYARTATGIRESESSIKYLSGRSQKNRIVHACSSDNIIRHKLCTAIDTYTDSTKQQNKITPTYYNPERVFVF